MIRTGDLRDALTATTAADGAAALARALVATCHSCDRAITEEHESPVDDVCAGCLVDCPCWVCRETRDAIGQDRAEQWALDLFRERS